MNFLSLLFALIVIPSAIFSQTTVEKTFSDRKMNIRKAVNHYLKKKINRSPEFSVYYTSLFSDLEGYTKTDTLLADKLINRLYRVDDILFYHLMRIRLEWEFKKHLQRASLDSISSLLKNSIDSAEYYYMMGIYLKDSLYERTARRFGYVKVDVYGKEIVDWRKMRSLKYGDPRFWELDIADPVFTINKMQNHKRDPIANAAIFFYKLAFKLDTLEFQYWKDLMTFLSILGDEAEIDKINSSNFHNYSNKQKSWLKKLLYRLHENQMKTIEILH